MWTSRIAYWDWSRPKQQQLCGSSPYIIKGTRSTTITQLGIVSFIRYYWLLYNFTICCNSSSVCTSKLRSSATANCWNPFFHHISSIFRYIKCAAANRSWLFVICGSDSFQSPLILFVSINKYMIRIIGWNTIGNNQHLLSTERAINWPLEVIVKWGATT